MPIKFNFGGIVRAMSHYEAGEPCPWHILLRGMALWFEDFISEIEKGKEKVTA